MSRSAAHGGADAVVVGGGVIGCAVARSLALEGLDVEVLERGVPGREASWAAAGMLAPRSEGGSEAFLRLGLRSLAAYPEFAAALRAETGVDVGLSLTGKLHVALSDAEAAILTGAVERAGGALEWLDPRAARGLEPDLTPDARGGAWCDSEGSVDPRRLGRALWLAAARAGARFRLGARVLSLAPRGDRFDIQLADGSRLSAGRLVVAAGAWSGALSGPSGPLPVRPVRGQMASIRTAGGPRHVVFASAGYALRREGALALAGATEEDAGFEDRVTAAGVESVLAGWRRLFPERAGAPLGAVWSGLRPCAPDNLPVIGPDPAAPSFWYATGHFRNGILLAPETARICTSGLVRGSPPPDDFVPARFADGLAFGGTAAPAPPRRNPRPGGVGAAP